MTLELTPRAQGDTEIGPLETTRPKQPLDTTIIAGGVALGNSLDVDYIPNEIADLNKPEPEHWSDLYFLNEYDGHGSELRDRLFNRMNMSLDTLMAHYEGRECSFTEEELMKYDLSPKIIDSPIDAARAFIKVIGPDNEMNRSRGMLDIAAAMVISQELPNIAVTHEEDSLADRASNIVLDFSRLDIDKIEITDSSLSLIADITEEAMEAAMLAGDKEMATMHGRTLAKTSEQSNLRSLEIVEKNGELKSKNAKNRSRVAKRRALAAVNDKYEALFTVEALNSEETGSDQATQLMAEAVTEINKMLNMGIDIGYQYEAFAPMMIRHIAIREGVYDKIHVRTTTSRSDTPNDMLGSKGSEVDYERRALKRSSDMILTYDTESGQKQEHLQLKARDDVDEISKHYDTDKVGIFSGDAEMIYDSVKAQLGIEKINSENISDVSSIAVQVLPLMLEVMGSKYKVPMDHDPTEEITLISKSGKEFKLIPAEMFSQLEDFYTSFVRDRTLESAEQSYEYATAA